MFKFGKGGKCYMKISEVKKQALGALKGKWGLAVLATFVFFLIYIVVPMIIEIPFWRIQKRCGSNTNCS